MIHNALNKIHMFSLQIIQEVAKTVSEKEIIMRKNNIATTQLS